MVRRVRIEAKRRGPGAAASLRSSALRGGVARGASARAGRHDRRVPRLERVQHQAVVEATRRRGVSDSGWVDFRRRDGAPGLI